MCSCVCVGVCVWLLRALTHSVNILAFSFVLYRRLRCYSQITNKNYKKLTTTKINFGVRFSANTALKQRNCHTKTYKQRTDFVANPLNFQGNTLCASSTSDCNNFVPFFVVQHALRTIYTTANLVLLLLLCFFCARFHTFFVVARWTAVCAHYHVCVCHRLGASPKSTVNHKNDCRRY